MFDVTSKTLYFWTLSPNLNSSSRVTTATVIAGSGANAPKQEVTITQRGLLSSEFAVGQVIADNGSLKGGIVFWVNATNRGKAKIMSLDRENLAWSTAGTPASTGVDLSRDDGYTNTMALLHYQMHRKCLPLSSVWTRGQVGIGRGEKTWNKCLKHIMEPL